MLTTSFTTVMLALGIAVLAIGVVMIVGFAISMIAASGVSVVDFFRHRGHVDESTHGV